LSTAVHWGIIKENPAKRVKPPKVARKEAKSLDDLQTVHLLKAIQDEPVKFQLAVEMLLFLGARRGEVLADIDFNTCTVNIDKAMLYLPSKGVYEDTPKNETSSRVIKLPKPVIQKLYAYQKAQFRGTICPWTVLGGHRTYIHTG